ncbi:MAG: hypothetical protein ACLP8S_20690 [Solirubrobacteraceae bacterium]
MLAHATITAPEMVGVLFWWALMLCAPVILVRRWHRRNSPQNRLRLGRLRAAAARRGSTEITTPQPPARTSDGELSDQHAGPRAPELARESRGERRVARVAGELEHGQATRSRSASPAAGRLDAETLEPLCGYVDFRRRLALAVGELETRISQLPADRWRIEPYPLTGERRNTLLVLGETGVFVISATYSPGHWDDVVAASRLAAKIQLLLPGYRGQVQAAVCYPFSVLRPRIWHRPDEHGDWVGAWVLGGDSVTRWLEHFGHEHGLSTIDLERFDQLGEPNWLKAAIPTPPSWPAIPETASPDAGD